MKNKPFKKRSPGTFKAIASAVALVWLLPSLLRAEANPAALFIDPAKLTTTDAQVTLRAGALHVVTGHQNDWPGVCLPAPDGHWDWSPFAEVRLRVTNPGTNPVTVCCRIDNPGANGARHCVNASLKLRPGQSDTLKVALKREIGSDLGGKLFGMRGYPVGPGSADSAGIIDPKNITQILLFVAKPKENHQFDIADLAPAGAYHPPTASVTDADPFFPFIDGFGQYRHKNWPGKTQSLADLAAHRAAESADLAAHPGPEGWDLYGGAATGPQLKATGFFRTEKVDGKWWLVDPDGHLFFSHGVTCVRFTDATPIEERSTWFADFPNETGEFHEFFSRRSCLKGHYAGRTVNCFSFDGANLRRKYGAEWKAVSAALVHQRLRSWGLNTIANWSDDAVWRLRRTPYTDNLGSGQAKPIEGSSGYWAKFPDVYDPGFAATLRRGMAGKRNQSAGDPWCLGYFCDNEMSWGDEFSLAVAALQSPPDQAAKLAFIADLQAKYGDIAGLNAAWGTRHAAWDDLRQSREVPDLKMAREDLGAFYTRTAELYFRTVREVIRDVAPQQLYLGCRFAWLNERAAQAAAKYCDVVSFNLYQRSVAGFQFPGGADVPLIIGEFHFGALDRGLFHTGLVSVADQAARAQAYTDYVRGARQHPQFVGTHWFQYRDEPTIGRNFDEENYQIGFVDIADTPYAETIAASRAVGTSLYPTR